MRLPQLVAASLLAAAFLAPPASAAPKSVAITSPAAGATVSRAASDTLAVKGTSLFDAAIATGKTFFLRGNGCGATEDLYLSASKGTDDYDGCGIIGGVPLNEVIKPVETLDARDGLPVRLDGGKPITGTIRAESWIQNGVPGVGQVVVDVAMYGTTAGEDLADFGSTTVTAMNTGSEGVQVPFTLQVPESLAGVVLTGLTLEVTVRGANYNSSNLGMDGDSKFTLPILDSGSIQVSDTSSFTAARTRTVLPAADGTWAAGLPMPAAGAATIYARAVQGTTRLSAAPVDITVAP
jgi:hypothetical protein